MDLLPSSLTREQVKKLTGKYFDERLFNSFADSQNQISKDKLHLVTSHTDVYFCHDWGTDEMRRNNHSRVSTINERLRSRGLCTWFDEERMTGDIRTQMVTGLDNTQCVLVFLTKRLMDIISDNDTHNCALEFQYASKRKDRKLIPIVMEEGMKNPSVWNRQVAIVLGNILYIDMSGDFNDEVYLNQSIENLYKAIVQIIGTPVISLTISSDQNLASHYRSESSALNDNAKGVDRFGYSAYAKALYTMLNRAVSPICVGLFAKWGSGKSFMMHLLKQEFDPTATEDPVTFEIIQWFDDKREIHHPPVLQRNSFFTRCSFRFKLIRDCLKPDFSSLSYSTLAWFLIFNDIFQELEVFYNGYRSLPNEDPVLRRQIRNPPHQMAVSPENPSYPLDDEESGNASLKKSYVFVDFNAWEFNKSDQLWVGLIRTMYHKVERRLEAYRDDSGVPRDYKRIWRAQKAKDEVVRSYGGLAPLRRRIILILISCLILFTCIVLAIVYLPEMIKFYRLHRGGGLASLLAFLVVLMGTALPMIELIARTGKESNTSQGERIYNEASAGVQDSLGFLHRVRQELDELFCFLGQIYQQETGESIILVIFIDDLDRCVGEGRIVFVLEALQLLLNIPGAPVIAFLAVDSRIVASSIEATLNTSLCLTDTPVTGWEYLDKIIQVPFCLPPPPPEKIVRLLMNSLAGSDISLPVVARRLRHLITLIHKAMLKMPSTLAFPLIGFLEEDLDAKEKSMYSFHKIYDLLYSQIFHSAVDDAQLVTEAALSLLSKSTSNIAMKAKLMNRKEGLELICRSVNFCLYNFEFSSESNATNDIMDNLLPNQRGEYDIGDKKSVKSAIRSSNDVDYLKVIREDISASTLPMLVQPEVLTALQEVSIYLDPNPRKLKRIANILQLVAEVAKNTPVSEMAPDQMLWKEPGWDIFMVKVVMWIGLSECYPFRTSLLVQILEDFDQKITYGVRNSDGVVHYAGVEELDFENMSLIEFYYKFVAHIAPLLSGYPKLIRLDSDPEKFVSYLSQSLTYLVKNKCAITCADVLGPLKDTARRLRDLNFSLLSHSFNLNPAMRNTFISLDIQSIETKYQLTGSQII